MTAPQSEAQIQKAVIDQLKARAAPGVVFFHVPNDPSSRRKSGYRAGVSDLCFVFRGEFFALELKAENGRPTIEQMQFVSDVNAAGGYACIAEGFDQAISILESWGILRPDRSDVRRAA